MCMFMFSERRGREPGGSQLENHEVLFRDQDNSKTKERMPHTLTIKSPRDEAAGRNILVTPHLSLRPDLRNSRYDTRTSSVAGSLELITLFHASCTSPTSLETRSQSADFTRFLHYLLVFNIRVEYDVVVEVWPQYPLQRASPG